ncbi:MAG: hypothetical protein L0956_06360 [Candidatus Mariimomonas ferrooxydans]
MRKGKSVLHWFANTESALRTVVFLVALHTMGLGFVIYFFTDSYYNFFFGTDVENFFFVRLAGIFLICNGIFYLVPLVSFARLHTVINAIIITKIIAVVFLVSNAGYVLSPSVIYAAAFVDGLMAFVLVCLYARYRKKNPCARF